MVSLTPVLRGLLIICVQIPLPGPCPTHPQGEPRCCGLAVCHLVFKQASRGFVQPMEPAFGVTGKGFEMGWEGKHNFFLLQELELGGAEKVVEKYDLVPVAVGAHSGLDCGPACLSLSFQVALKGK